MTVSKQLPAMTPILETLSTPIMDSWAAGMVQSIAWAFRV
ncbi:hypothetical protein SAMN05192583_3263 [Sphingomonas gellani]|uniref:Uncharacterized protein n=1 Tax=Sphingomonas gellani TaxID=1166340 RepID=A0A1H8IC26_9SPHN|nr:hypothetical protein SAMN05192583_3263 [Sphingomonas gellani]